MPIIVGNTTTNSAITSTSLSEMVPQSFVVTNALRNSVRPALLLPFAQSGTVDPRITFTRASSATYFNSQGVLTTAANDVPRIDFDPATGRCLGLLIEVGRTNLLLQSNFATNWGNAGTPTVTLNAATSPDGTSNAVLWTRITTASSNIGQNISKAASALVYTFSVFVKASVGNYVALRTQGAYPARADVVFNLSNGTISTAAVATSTFTGASATIQALSNGWYRISLTATSDTTTNIQGYISFNSGGGVIDQVDSVSNSAGYLYGAQMEQASFVSSYIATTTAAATRIREYARIPLGSWYNASAFSLLVEAQKNIAVDPEYGTPVELNDGTTTRRTTIYNDIFTATMRFEGGGANILAGTYTPGVPYKMAGAITGTSTTTGTIAASFNGAAAVTGTTTNLNSASYTNMTIGYIGTPGGAHQMNGWIQRIAYYPVAFSNTQLQAMSS